MNAQQWIALIGAISVLIGAVTGLIIAIARAKNGVVTAINNAANHPAKPIPPSVTRRPIP